MYWYAEDKFCGLMAAITDEGSIRRRSLTEHLAAAIAAHGDRDRLKGSGCSLVVIVVAVWVTQTRDRCGAQWLMCESRRCGRPATAERSSPQAMLNDRSGRGAVAGPSLLSRFQRSAFRWMMCGGARTLGGPTGGSAPWRFVALSPYRAPRPC